MIDISSIVFGKYLTDNVLADKQIPTIQFQSDEDLSSKKKIGFVVWVRTHYQNHQERWYKILRLTLPAMGLAAGVGLAIGALSSAPVAYTLGAGLLGLAWVQGGRVALRTSSNLKTKPPAAPVVIEDPRLTLVALPAGVF